MTILYTQIIKLPDQRILTGEFSPQSITLKPSNEVIKELRDVIKELPSSSTVTFYTFESQDKNFVFYIRIVKELAFLTVNDRYTTSKLASLYYDKVEEKFKEIYTNDPKTTYYTFDPTLKTISDTFNKETKYTQGMAVVEETKGMLAKSLNMIIQREENINNLKGLANRMSVEAQLMKKNVQRMHLKSVLNDYWVYVIIVVVLVLFIYYLTH